MLQLQYVRMCGSDTDAAASWLCDAYCTELTTWLTPMHMFGWLHQCVHALFVQGAPGAVLVSTCCAGAHAAPDTMQLQLA